DKKASDFNSGIRAGKCPPGSHKNSGNPDNTAKPVCCYAGVHEPKDAGFCSDSDTACVHHMKYQLQLQSELPQWFLQFSGFSLFYQKQAGVMNELAGSSRPGRRWVPWFSRLQHKVSLIHSVLSMQNGCILHIDKVQVGESPEFRNGASVEGVVKCLNGVKKLSLRSYCGDLKPVKDEMTPSMK
ncbi:hypothetical protein MTO96_033911, partial [Rhipicephalus appendiculatus]